MPDAHPVARVGSTNTSVVGRKRGSRAAPSGSPPPGPTGAPRPIERLGPVADAFDDRRDDQGHADRTACQIPPNEPGAPGSAISHRPTSVSITTP